MVKVILKVCTKVGNQWCFFDMEMDFMQQVPTKDI